MKPKTDKLAAYRLQVKTEGPHRTKMSDSAINKLRVQNEATRVDKIATDNFLQAFKRLPKDTWTLVEVLKRILSSSQTALTNDVKFIDGEAVISSVPKPQPPNESPWGYGAGVLERMANKLICFLQHGWSPRTVGDVAFLAELTREERKMSDDNFYLHLDEFIPNTPISLQVKPETAETTETTIKEKREWWTPERCSKKGLCRAGRLCLWAKRGKPAPRAEGKRYCKPVCQEAYALKVKKAV